MRAALVALLVTTLAACSDLQSVVGPAGTRDAGASDGPPDVTLVFDVQPLDIPRITFDIPTVDVPVVVPSHDYGPVEDAHMMFDHLAIAYLRSVLRP